MQTILIYFKILFHFYFAVSSEGFVDKTYVDDQ